MKEMELEDYVKLGSDWRSGHLFISGEGVDIGNVVCHLIAKDIGLDSGKIHDLTTIVRKNDIWSRTGRNYLSDKMIHLQVKLQVNAELVDDLPIPEKEQEIEKKIRLYKEFGDTRSEALESIKRALKRKREGA